MIHTKINLNVEEFTSPNIFSVKYETPLNEIYKVMKSENIRHVPVVENKQTVGVISKRDLDTIDVDDLTKLMACDIMVSTPYIVSRSEKIQDVAFEMSKRKVGSAIVEDNGEIYGIFTTTDALNALVEVVRGEI